MPEDIDSFRAGAALTDPFTYAGVELGASKAASHDENMLFGRIQAVFLHSSGFHLGRAWHKHAPDRIPCHDNLVFGEESLHALIGHADALHLVPEFLVGQSGKAVLLLYQGRNTEFRGCHQQGSARVASHSNGYLRLELFDQLAGLADTGQHPERHAQAIHDILDCQLPLESRNRQADDLVTCRGHLLHLHLAFGSHEKDLRLRIDLLKFVGD